MNFPFKARLRDARYALPGLVGRCMAGESAGEAARSLAGIGRQGMAASAGYFPHVGDTPAAIAATYAGLARELAGSGGDILLSLKAPALGFGREPVRRLAGWGLPLAFDSLAGNAAARTLDLAEEFAAGATLPARWRRSPDDARRLRDGPCRIRLVKGEWADPVADVPEIAQAYRELARILAGRKAAVAVATHDPALAEAALRTLIDAGTPCELEQLRGLPRRQTTAVASKLGVPVRLYYPFGPGWWPYALDKALARPYLPVWALKDLLAA